MYKHTSYSSNIKTLKWYANRRFISFHFIILTPESTLKAPKLMYVRTHIYYKPLFPLFLMPKNRRWIAFGQSCHMHTKYCQIHLLPCLATFEAFGLSQVYHSPKEQFPKTLCACPTMH